MGEGTVKLQEVLRSRAGRARTTAGATLSAATVLGWVDWTALGPDTPPAVVAAVAQAREAAEQAREAGYQASEAMGTAAALLETAALELDRAELAAAAAARPAAARP